MSQPARSRISHGLQEETWLEHRLADLRYRRSLRYLRRLAGAGQPRRGLDLGCGFHGSFVTRANQLPGLEFVGADVEVAAARPELFGLDLEAPGEVALPFTPDVVTMHAVLEHLADPSEALRWVGRILVPGGYLLATVPSPRARPVLEFLAFRLGVISAREIRDHKRYFERESLQELLQTSEAGLELVEHQAFQLGCNNWLVARRAS